MMRKYRLYIVVLFIGGMLPVVPAGAQESMHLKQYREKVLLYDHDLKASEQKKEMYEAQVQAARADFKPKVSAGLDYAFTGNPMELSLDQIGVTFQGRYNRYGLGVDLSQPIYTGGSLKANLERERIRSSNATQEIRTIRNNSVYQADRYYWQAVACKEVVQIAQQYMKSVDRLSEVVRQRVELEYTDRNDLLMTQVKLNDAHYQLLEARNQAEVARLAMNAYAGVALSDTLQTDSEVLLPDSLALQQLVSATSWEKRPELAVAYGRIGEQKESGKIAQAQFKPQLYVGAQGNYSAPGYDFRSDMDPNYSISATFRMPLWEWGKHKQVRRASDHAVAAFQENYEKTVERLCLEVATARVNLEQAMGRMVLSESSLAHAAENEMVALDQYQEGRVSIVEVINAQIYHQQACLNFIQAKLDVQIARSDYERACGQHADGVG